MKVKPPREGDTVKPSRCHLFCPMWTLVSPLFFQELRGKWSLALVIGFSKGELHFPLSLKLWKGFQTLFVKASPL